MATNGKGGNNMTPNMNYTNNSNSQKEEGIFGYLQNRNTKSSFAKDYWREGSGYLDSALKDLKEMQKLYKELEKSQNKMSTSQENQFKSQKRALELQIATLEDIKQTQDVNDRQALRSIQDSNKLRQKGLVDYQRLLDNIAKRQELLKKGDKELAAQLREDAEYINEMYASINKEIEQQNLNIETTGEKLKNTTGSFAKAMSNTLKSASDELTSLLNMFNLDKLANSGLNKFINDKISVQNEMMKQFGFETKNQYIDFKNGLDATLGSMGSLYNGTDLKNYMSNLSSMGITNTRMAQEQMRASIMGSKYLGVSTETQTEMFKWMKRTNDYDMLDEHNKVITGLLKSQLGVSKEQLDELTRIAYENNNTMASIGMTSDAISAVNNASLLVGHSLMGAGIDKATAGELQKMYEDFITAPIEDLQGYAAMGVTNSYNLQNAMRTAESTAVQTELAKTLFSELLSSNALTGGDTQINQYIQRKYPSLNIDQMAGLRGLNFGKFTENLNTDLENVEGALAGIKSEQKFVQETTEITWLENIYNRLDKFFTSLDTAGIFDLVTLANTVFALWTGSKIFDVYSKISELGLLSKLVSSSTAMTKLGTSGSGILANGGGILIGTAAIAAIASAVGTTLNIANSEESLNKFTENYGKKTKLGKAGTLFRAGATSSAALLGVGAGKLFKDEALEAKSRWLNVSSNFTSGLYGDKASLYQLAAMMAFDKADWLKYTGVTDKHDDLVKRYNKLNDDEKAWVKKFATRDTDLSPLIKDLDWNNYHKAGLNKVPRDNYKALLHKGEMVLSEEEANAYRRGFGIGGYEAVPWPITSKYNSMSKIRSGYHTGTDFGAPAGTPVGAAISGEIVQRSWGSAWGNHIIVKGDNGLYYLYAHLSKKAIDSGRVETGQTIGYVGSTGNSTGPHLHFEVQRNSNWSRGNELDPAPYVTSGLLGDSSAITPTIEETYGNLQASQNSSSFGTIKNSDGSTSSTIASTGIPVRTGKFIPSSISKNNSNGMGGADMIVNSVNGGFGRLLSYLDNVRQNQDIQREMLNTFSRVNSESAI